MLLNMALYTYAPMSLVREKARNNNEKASLVQAELRQNTRVEINMLSSYMFPDE